MGSTRVQLLDDEEGITPKFEQVLLNIFKKYAALKSVRRNNFVTECATSFS